MPRPKEKVLEKLREQTDFLRTSLRGFYEGQFAESLHRHNHSDIGTRDGDEQTTAYTSTAKRS
jgi:hypothetical protein